MSTSPPSTTNAATTTSNSTTLRYESYWCYECHTSVHFPATLFQPFSSSSSSSSSSFISISPPTCPHCRHDFLEPMDPSIPHPPPYYPTSYPDPSSPIDHDATTTTTTVNSIPLQANPTPASKNALESLHHIIIDPAFLVLDPSIVCPVCKDQFVVSSEAKRLPCKHTYHSDCILPWLQNNNSCPVCRYRLPSECDERNENERESESFTGAGVLDDAQALFFGYPSTLRNVVIDGDDVQEEHNSSGLNWNRRGFQWDNEVLLSPTQIGEVDGVGVEGGIGDHVERANSMQTVSTWLRWPVEGGASASGSGDGEFGVGASSGDGVVKRNGVRS